MSENRPPSEDLIETEPSQEKPATFEGSVLQLMVYSRAAHLDALTICVALLVGGALLGIPGALLAIPVAEIIRVIVTDVLAYRRSRRGEEEEEEPAVSSPSLQPPPA